MTDKKPDILTSIRQSTVPALRQALDERGKADDCEISLVHYDPEPLQSLGNVEERQGNLCASSTVNVKLGHILVPFLVLPVRILHQQLVLCTLHSSKELARLE